MRERAKPVTTTAKIGTWVLGAVLILFAVVVISAMDRSNPAPPRCTPDEGAAVNGLNLPGHHC